MKAKYLYQFFLKAIENGYPPEEIEIEAHHDIIYIRIELMGDIQHLEGWMPVDIFYDEHSNCLAMFT